MRQGSRLSHSVMPVGIALLPHSRRREFMKGLGALAGSAAFLGYDLRLANAEPPPETTKLRIHENDLTCIAPQLVAQEMLHAEGLGTWNTSTSPRTLSCGLRGPPCRAGGHDLYVLTDSYPIHRCRGAGRDSGGSPHRLRGAGRERSHPIDA